MLGESLYTNEARAYVNSKPWPVRLQWEIKEYREHLQFIMFRDNLNTLTPNEILHAAKCINEVMDALRKSGLPIYVEVARSRNEE